MSNYAAKQSPHRVSSGSTMQNAALAASKRATHPMVHLQRVLGNQGVGRLLGPPGPKLPGIVKAGGAVSEPGDLYEHEADRIADQVMRTASAPPCACGGHCAKCQSKGSAAKPGRVQMKRLGPGKPGNPVPSTVNRVLSSPGRPLDGASRVLMESRFGQDFGGVRIHADGAAAESAEAINAQAYTSGRHVVFGAGAYDPYTTPGLTLLAHELVHTIQQDGSAGSAIGASPVIQRKARDERPAVTKIEFWKPDRAVMFLDNGRTFTAAVISHCDPLPGSYRVRVKGGSDSFTFEKITPAPPCQKTSPYYLHLQYDSRLSEPGSEIEITIISAEVSEIMKSRESPAGIRLDAESRSRIAAAIARSGMTKGDWLEFMHAGSDHRLTAEEFADALERYADMRRATTENELKTAKALQTDLASTMKSVRGTAGVPFSGRGLDDSMTGIYKDYQEWTKLISMSAMETVQFLASHKMKAIALGAFRQALEDRIQTALSKAGISRIMEFRMRIASFEAAFRTATVNLALNVLYHADKICKDFLIERAEVFYTRGWHKAAKTMIAAVDPLRAPLQAEVERADELADKAKRRQAEIAWNALRTHDPDLLKSAGMAVAKDDAMEAESRKQAALDLVAHALPQFPFIAWPDFPKEKLLDAKDPADVMYWVDWYLLEHRAAIQSAIDQLVSKPSRIYKLDILLSLAKKQFQIADGSIFDLIIADEVKEASEESTWEKIKTALMFALAIISIIVPGGVGVAAAVAGTALSASQAIDMLKQYYGDLAAYKANLASVEPSQFWVIAAVIGAGLDAKGAVDLLSHSAALRKAVEHFRSLRDPVKLSKELEAISELTPEARQAIKEEAEKQLAADTRLGKSGPEPAPPAASAPAKSSESRDLYKGIDGDTRTMLAENHEEIKAILDEHPGAADFFKRCGSTCFPKFLKGRKLKAYLMRMEVLEEKAELAGFKLNKAGIKDLLHAQTDVEGIEKTMKALEDELKAKSGFDAAAHGVPEPPTHGDPRLDYGKRSPPTKASAKGTAGFGEHALEEVAQVPGRLTAQRAAELRKALYRGKMTLADIARELPPEGVAEFMFPTDLGRRFVDHVFVDVNAKTFTVVFRESKNVTLFKLTPDVMNQLEKDLWFLDTEAFKGARIEWRISGNIDKAALDHLQQLTKDMKGRFSFVLDTAPTTYVGEGYFYVPPTPPVVDPPRGTPR